MSYAHIDYTPVSENYALPYLDQSLQNQHGTSLMKKHKCRYCNYVSNRPRNIRRHVQKKHLGMNNKDVQGCGDRNMYKHVGEIPPSSKRSSEEAQVVYKPTEYFESEVLKKRKTKRGTEYLVHYIGYPDSMNQWVKASDLKKL